MRYSGYAEPSPFFSRANKKQMRACVRVCDVFRKKVTVVKGSFLRAAKIENVAVSETENVKFCQKLGKSALKRFR
jgi:hypothetical protein